VDYRPAVEQLERHTERACNFFVLVSYLLLCEGRCASLALAIPNVRHTGANEANGLGYLVDFRYVVTTHKSEGRKQAAK